MIIVEGPDGSGKTTLAKWIVAHIGGHYCRPPEAVLSSRTGPGQGLLQWWMEQFELDHHANVYDRCMFISDPIYSNVMHQEPRITVAQCIQMRDMFDNGVNVLIFCLPEKTVLDGEQLIGYTPEVRRAVEYLYELESHNWLSFVYDWTNRDELEEFLDEVNRKADR